MSTSHQHSGAFSGDPPQALALAGSARWTRNQELLPPSLRKRASQALGAPSVLPQDGLGHRPRTPRTSPGELHLLLFFLFSSSRCSRPPRPWDQTAGAPAAAWGSPLLPAAVMLPQSSLTPPLAVSTWWPLATVPLQGTAGTVQNVSQGARGIRDSTCWDTERASGSLPCPGKTDTSHRTSGKKKAERRPRKLAMQLVCAGRWARPPGEGPPEGTK